MRHLPRIAGALFLVAYSGGLVGCATMAVKVEIFDREYYPHEAELAEAVRGAAADVAVKLERNEYDADRAEQKVRLFEQIEDTPEIAKLLNSDEASAALNEMVGHLTDLIDSQIQAAREKHESGLRQWEAIRYACPDDHRRRRLQSAYADFMEGNKLLSELPSKLREEADWDSLTAAFARAAKASATRRVRRPDKAAVERIEASVTLESEKAVAKVTEAAEKAASKRTRGLIADNGIREDRLASYVVNAPAEAWQGMINLTQAFGGLGNTDIAVKMEDTGEFTLKGVRVDADKVTRATFTVVKQAVQLIAAANGIPIPGSDATAAAKQPDSSAVSTVASADRDLAMAKARVRAARRAEVLLFEAIVSHRNELRDATKRAAAIESMKSSFDGLKAHLVPPADTAASGKTASK